MGKLAFCERFVFLDKEPISFAGRDYLPAVYAADGNLVLRCSRQTEKSTFLVNTILYEACTRPGVQMLFVCPRLEQARVFSGSRLLLSLNQSPLIRRMLLGCRGRRPQVTNMQFANGSTLFIRAAYHSGDSCRGLSADLLLVDEFQDIAEGDLPVLQETMSHAKNPRTILTGTPKSIDNHLESVFRQSTAHEWTIDCPACGKGVILDERSIGATGVSCPDCGDLVDPRRGRWIARNPHATWGDGYWVCHPMVPWLNYDKILDRQQTYDLAKFKNEVLGLPTTAGDHMVTRAELEACCSEAPFAQSHADVPPQARPKLIAGIDWGGGGVSRTVIVIGYMRSDYRFHVLRFDRFAATEDPEHVIRLIAQSCNQFKVRQIAVDGGGQGHVYNRMLLSRLGWQSGVWAIHYSATDHEPTRDGALFRWTVNRSASIGVVFSRVKKNQIIFPRATDCGSYLDEFACEIAEYDDINRTIRFTHPATQQDDALHATNYALLLGVLLHSDERRSIYDCR